MAVSSPVDSAPKCMQRRSRLRPREREQMILEEAIEFFAEYGFEAQMRCLAERLGVSQALVYRYFPTKELLIERVYQRVFLARWNPAWERILKDRARPLRERLKAFLRSYIDTVDDPRWIRIAMHSSLSRRDLTRRYLEVIVADLLALVAREVRDHQCKNSDDPLDEREIELAWHLHSTIIYYLVRKHIHATPVSGDLNGVIDDAVDNFFRGLARRAP